MNVLITGGSRGIGAACVRAFCQAGHRVAFFYRQSDACAQALSKEYGATAIIDEPNELIELLKKLG